MVWPGGAHARVPVQLQESLKLLESSRTVGCAVLGEAGEIQWSNSRFREWLGLDDGDPVPLLCLRDCVGEASELGIIEGAIAAGGGEGIGFRLGLAESAGVPVTGDLVACSEKKELPRFALILCAAGNEQKLEAGMERSARLEALGSLTSGVAHDFNNLLTILVGNLSLVAEELRADPRKFAKIKAARDAARRGSELIKQLLSFARQEPVPSQLINPGRIIARIAPLIERALGKTVALELDLEEHLDPIGGNSAQLESVIVNLAVNARDAIEGSGCVRISVNGAGGRILRIEVSDDGTGMPPDIAARVFEPFFTTKPEGRGSGLGLSMVRSYAEQFDGKATIETQAGVGTTVRLEFPLSSGTVEDSAAMTMPVASLPAGNEHVVVLARDDGLSAMIVQILGVLGYRCDAARDLQELSDLARASAPDLVICDGFDSSPEIDSRAGGIARPFRTLRLLTAGEAGSIDTPDRLCKPFSIPDLAFATRKILDRD